MNNTSLSKAGVAPAGTIFRHVGDVFNIPCISGKAEHGSRTRKDLFSAHLWSTLKEQDPEKNGVNK